MTQFESLDNRPRNCNKIKQEDCQNWCKHLKQKTQKGYFNSQKNMYIDTMHVKLEYQLSIGMRGML